MRRFFLQSIAVFALLFGLSNVALAETKYTDYSESVLAAAETSGKPYLLDFYASWCSTCRTQDNVIGKLQAEDTKYKMVKVIRVDWDDAASKPLIKTNKIPRRSTLVIFKGKAELGRVVAQTSTAKIRALLELGL